MIAAVLFGLVVVAVLFVVPAWTSWRARKRLLGRIRAEWSYRRNIPRDMDAVSDVFRSRGAAALSLDDRTWNDLLLDDVFAQLDRTESSVGQQVLYGRLRSAPSPQSLEAFDALITAVASDPARRERTQARLAGLRSPAAYNVHRLAGPDALTTPRWHNVIPIWTVVALFTMSLAYFRPEFVLAGAVCFVGNVAIRIVTAHRAVGQIAWFRQLGPLLSVAGELVTFGTPETAPITGALAADLASLRRLGRIARWLSRDPLATDYLAFIVLEFINLLLLMDANAFYFASRELQVQGPQLLRVIEAVGEIDAAIAVASFRSGVDGWIRPRFGSPDSRSSFADLRHPLVEPAVPNSIGLAPPHGVLITGSNMSGKSTFLRTVGINAVLAQTINTCLARGYEAPVYQVRSCIGRSDDLIAGKSYYLVEVEAVLALLNASMALAPHLFIFDELFRGTNAVERIAAAEAVLAALIEGGKPHVVLAATHDGELVDLLRDSYTVCHFGDAVGPDGLTFDYRLTPGPATSRNAIALLELSGAPEAVVKRALARAAELDRQRLRLSPRA
jgi:hypothetical protein